MQDDLSQLVEAIRRVFPASQFEPVAEADLAAIRAEHPDVPEHYVSFLKHVGWGSLGDGNFMIYSGLMDPDEIYDPKTAAEFQGILFFGDNFAGWNVGFDTRSGWRIVGVDSGSMQPYPESASTIAALIAQRVADREAT